MTALNGCVPYTSGQVYYDRMELGGNLGRLSPQIGYVPQDDIMHPELTVREVLYYSARLKSPGTTDEEIHARAERVCRDLNLFKQLDTPIGSATRKTLSGGQKKRVNLGMELMTDPKVLFLDEPTSGLSSKDTRDVMEILRNLADSKGIAIIITIHQPSARVYQLMDKVIYLKAGKLCYFGPTYPDSISYFKGEECDPDLEGPDAVMEVLDEREEAEMEQEFSSSPIYDEFVARREGQTQGEAASARNSMARIRRPNPAQQFIKLLGRYLLCKVRDRSALAILILQAPLIAILLGWTFQGQGLNAPLFMLVFVSLWFGVNNSARELVGERSIYRREVRSGLSPGAYFLSKFSGQALFSAIQCGLLLGISFPLLGLEAFFPMLFLLCWLCSLAGISIGLLVSAFSRSEVSAIVMVPLILIPFILFGGLLKTYEDMDVASRGVSALVPARWGYESAIQVENLVRNYELPVPVIGEEEKTEFVPFYPEEDLKEENQTNRYRWFLLQRGTFLLGFFIWFPSILAFLRLRKG